MTLLPFHNRPFRFHRESRELRQHLSPRNPAQPQGPAENDLPGVNALGGFLKGLGEWTTKLFSSSARRDDLQARSRAELSNPRRWIEAFRQHDVFTQPQVLMQSFENEVVNPGKLLQTMNPQERAAQLWNFAREVLPPRLTRLIPPSTTAVPSDSVRDTAVTVIAIVLGLRPVDGETRPDVLAYAKEAFGEIYPSHFGHIYEDYRELVRQLSRIPGVSGALTPSARGNREQLLKIFSENEERLPPGQYLRFAGWLRANSAEPMDRKTSGARLAALAEQFSKDEQRDKLNTLESQHQMEQLQKGVKMDAERRNRTFMQNFASLEPWQQYAVIGLGLFAAWKLWKKQGRFLGIIPYWTIPTGLVGFYLYRRLIVGDHDALNTMTGSVQRGAQKAWDWTSENIFSRGILAPTVEREDATRMSIMARFLNQRAFLSHFPIAAPMMTVAEIKMKHFAGGAFRATMMPGNRIEYSLCAEPQDTLYKEAQRIIKHRRYDRETLHRIFFDHNAEIAQGVGTVFYHLAARRPENRDRVRRIERARNGSAVVTPDGTSNMSYDNIRDPAIKQDFLNMIGEGRTIASQDYPEMNLADLIQTFVAEPAIATERPDNADRVAVPNLNQPRQRDLLAVREQPLIAERKTSIELIRREFEEWIDKHSSDRFPILRREPLSAGDKLRNYARLLFESGQPLNEIAFALERIKNVILATAAVRGGRFSVTDQDIEVMLGRLPEHADEPGFIPRITASAMAWFNSSVFTIASNFQSVRDLASVDAVLSQRLFADVQSGAGALSQLRAQVRSHRARFERLRNERQAAEAFANQLAASDSAAVTRLGGRPQAIAFFQRLTGNGNPQYRAFIDQSEQYYAVRIMNDIIVAQIGTHRRSGDHTLDIHPPQRFISQQEEQNLIANNDFLLERIIGTDVRPLNGMWAAMAMRQVLAELNDPGNRLNVADEQSSMAAVNRVRRLAALYLALQPISAAARRLPALSIPPLLGGAPSVLGGAGALSIDLLDIGVRERVREIAREFRREWNGVDVGHAQARLKIVRDAAVAAMAKVRADNAPALKKAQEALKKAREQEAETKAKLEPVVKLAEATLEQVTAKAKTIRDEAEKKIKAMQQAALLDPTIAALMGPATIAMQKKAEADAKAVIEPAQKALQAAQAPITKAAQNTKAAHDGMSKIQSIIDAADQAEKKNVQDAAEALEKALKAQHGPREALLKRESFREGGKDIIGTMRLLGITVPEDLATLSTATLPTFLDVAGAALEDLAETAKKLGESIWGDVEASAKELGENAAEGLRQIEEGWKQLTVLVEASAKELGENAADGLRQIEEGWKQLIVLWEQWQKEGGDAGTELGKNVEEFFKTLEGISFEFLQRGEKTRKEYAAMLEVIQNMRKTIAPLLPANKDAILKPLADMNEEESDKIIDALPHPQNTKGALKLLVRLNKTEARIRAILAPWEPAAIKRLEEWSKKIWETLRNTRGADQVPTMQETMQQLLKRFRPFQTSLPPEGPPP